MHVDGLRLLGRRAPVAADAHGGGRRGCSGPCRACRSSRGLIRGQVLHILIHPKRSCMRVAASPCVLSHYRKQGQHITRGSRMQCDFARPAHSCRKSRAWLLAGDGSRWQVRANSPAQAWDACVRLIPVSGGWGHGEPQRAQHAEPLFARVRVSSSRQWMSGCRTSRGQRLQGNESAMRMQDDFEHEEDGPSRDRLGWVVVMASTLAVWMD